MLVGLLAQAGGLLTMLRILILENRRRLEGGGGVKKLVNGDWKEEAASKARHRQARR